MEDKCKFCKRKTEIYKDGFCIKCYAKIHHEECICKECGKRIAIAHGLCMACYKRKKYHEDEEYREYKRMRARQYYHEVVKQDPLKLEKHRLSSRKSKKKIREKQSRKQKTKEKEKFIERDSYLLAANDPDSIILRKIMNREKGEENA